MISIGLCIWPVASAFVRSSLTAFFASAEFMSARTATTAGLAPPGNASLMRLIAFTVGQLCGTDSKPIWPVWMCRTGSAIATSTAADAIADRSGCSSAGVRIADQKRFSPLARRKRVRNGMRPFSIRSPSLPSSAGSTVSEPIIAMPTTIIVAMPNE